ncbi:MAG: hypothetical protein RBU21_00385 [FCB group bacterium]|nr:hypothetical protein [FCB group bacterium]
MRNILGWIVVALLVMGAASAENGASTLPKATLKLADFETAGSVAIWTGIDHTQTAARASTGSNAMTFSIPKYIQGKEERPGVRLPFADGKGFPSRDFSRFGKIVADVWVEGAEPGKMGLKLVDLEDQSSWTTHITVEPGKWNSAELLIDDAAADCDVRNVDYVVLYALRPETAYTLVVDNIRLEPRDKPHPPVLTLRYPNYRGLVFPDGGDIEMSVSVLSDEFGLEPRDFALELSLVAKGKTHARKKTLRGDSYSLTLPSRRLEEGPATLTARLLRRDTGEELARREWSVRKVSAAEQASMKSYIDRANNLILDGEPFFPLGWYGSAKEEHLAEIADSAFNTLLAYGTNHVSKDKMLGFLDIMQAKGMKLVYCMNDVYPTATYFEGKDWEGVTGNDNIAAAAVAAYKDHPAVLAWYLNDELPRKLVPDLTEYYERIKAADPNHPCFIVLCNRSELPYFPDTTDILGVDPYPIPQDPITRVSAFADAAREAVHGAKPVWLVPQAFAWYQYKSKNKDRGHIPTPDELKTGRAPNYPESRCMTYLSLVHGAKGLLFYCYYDLRVLPQYNEMWDWMKGIGAEVKTLSPVLLSPEDLGTVKFTPESAPIHTLLKRHDGKLYLIAVNSGNEAAKVTFELKRRLPKQVDVMFEDRKADAAGRRFSDEFQPLEVHVYDLGKGRG